MKSVLLRAPVLTMSGYGVYARQVARWLFDKAEKDNSIDITTELLNWGQTPWYTDAYAQDGLIGKCLQASSYPKEQYDVTIQLQLPNEWCPELGKFNVGVTAGVESDRCNPEWIASVNKMDLVIVLSEFTKSVLVNSGDVKTPIVVVPCSFPDEILRQDSIAPLDLETKTKFNFLVFGQMTGGDANNDRKNLPYTLKWLFDEFQNDPDVGVVLKTNMGRMSKVDRLICQNSLKGFLQTLNKQDNPKFYLLHGEMTEEEIVGLCKNPTMKALVSLTHGEGFGLPILEAAACGLPVIASGWSAHTEFLGLGKYLKVDTTVGPIPASRVDGQIWMAGTNWGNPSEADFKKKARKFYEASFTPKQWAKDLQTKLLPKYSFQEISKQYSKVFEGVL